MGKILKLPKAIANKIAAGEIVERPASVIKECVENSIDANATIIEVIIEKAGKELLQIIDNGEGMSEEDAIMAFERHATSKIKEIDDLENINTLGFRGEALPSIASVSILELKTRTAETDSGNHFYFNGGNLDWKKPVAMNRGTNLSIKNLFFNTPARRNFLRSDTAELQRILGVLKRFFLGFPAIHFKVTVNGKKIYDLPAQSRDTRIKEVFGKQIYDGMIHFIEEKDGVVLEGYIARPDLARNSRGMDHVFLNLRPIQNKSLNFAVIQAYGNLIERRQYPPYIMYINIPPDRVDVNVHPTKMEVKFQKEQFMFQLFSGSVKKAFTRENIIPSFSFDKNKGESLSPKSQQGFPASSGEQLQSSFRQGRLDLASSLNPQKFQQDFSLPHLNEKNEENGKNEKPDFNVEQPVSPEIQPETTIPIFQLQNRYILAQIESGLVIIDQHVAHERILYEKTLKGLDKKENMTSQQLLFPQTLELSIEDYLIYSEIKNMLYKMGFSTSELSGNTIVINSIPVDVKTGYEGKVLLEIIDEYKTNKDGHTSSQERMAAAYACKNAIKSGDKITVDEMNILIEQLFLTSEPYFCPHGRPVIITLPLEELDRKFKRIK